MSLAGDVALGAAERVRRTLGPRAGLLSYRALAGSAAESETRGRAVLAGLACALELDDEAAADALVGLYTSVTTGLFEADVRRQVLAMLARAATGPGRRAFAQCATALAALEAERFPRARAAYLHARSGILQSPLMLAFQRATGDRFTTRNWATLEKMVANAT